MASDLVGKLFDVLSKAQKSSTGQSVRIRDWRTTVSRDMILSAGIRNNISGSIYAPPSLKSLQRGDIYIIWNDGKCSHGTVESNFLNKGFDWDRQLDYWRMAAFEDMYIADIPLPQTVPEVKVDNHAVRELVYDDNEPVFESLRLMLDKCSDGIDLNANIMCSSGINYIQSSTGLAVEYPDTRYVASWSLDSVIGNGFAQRRPISEKEMEGLWEDSLAMNKSLQRQGAIVGANTEVVFTPSVLGQFLAQYILNNFNGESVLEGQSRFSREQFENRTRLFSKNLQLEINPLLPEKWGSYPLTTEGVSACVTTLINEGALFSPYLNVKNAKRWGTKPTALPAGGSGIVLKHQKTEEWADVLKDIADGVIVHSVLGIHTQNPVTGQYTLAAPHSLRVINGKITGKADIKISGDFWGILKSEDTKTAYSDLYNNPYLISRSKAENM